MPGDSVWEWSEMRQQFYFHSFFRDTPDLNLRNNAVVEEIHEIFRYLLNLPAVYGVQIGGFNVLFDEDRNGTRVSDVNATVNFLAGLREIAEGFRKDGDMDERLFLLEMVEATDIGAWNDLYRHETLETAVIPYTFGDQPWSSEEFSGDFLHHSILNYLSELPNNGQLQSGGHVDFALPCWELNHAQMHVERESSVSLRIPGPVSDVALTVSMLLPGTVILFYGDEVGMHTDNMSISCNDTRDPFALDPYTECIGSPEVTRDLARTPMQWDYKSFSGFVNKSHPNYNENAYKPWLPLSPTAHEINIFNETYDSESSLSMYKRLLELRSHEAIKDGSVYFPYHDEDVFSFLRQIPNGEYAYLVVVDIREELVEDEIDFTLILPNFPPYYDHGTLVFSSDPHQQHDIGCVKQQQQQTETQSRFFSVFFPFICHQHFLLFSLRTQAFDLPSFLQKLR